ncbi:MAG: tetratricopeptide repeat protein [Cyclobacteriaceae bacterium]
MKTCYLLLFLLVSFAVIAQEKDEEILDVDFEANKLNSEGYELMMAGQYEAAKKLFWQAINIDPDVFFFYENLANACEETNDQQGMLACYAKAKVHLPDEPNIFYFSGDVLQNNGRLEEAINDYTNAVKLAEKKGSQLLYLFYFNRGNSWLKLKNYQKAVRDYDEAIKLQPFHQPSFVNRGMSRYNLKDKEGACQDWQKGVKLGYEQAENYLNKFCK